MHERPLSYKRLRGLVAFVVLASFAVLGGFGFHIASEVPPIPDHYDPATGTLALDPVRAAAFEANAAHYADVFGKGRPEYAIAVGTLTDPEKQLALSAFCFWTSWAESSASAKGSSKGSEVMLRKLCSRHGSACERLSVSRSRTTSAVKVEEKAHRYLEV